MCEVPPHPCGFCGGRSDAWKDTPQRRPKIHIFGKTCSNGTLLTGHVKSCRFSNFAATQSPPTPGILQFCRNPRTTSPFAHWSKYSTGFWGLPCRFFLQVGPGGFSAGCSGCVWVCVGFLPDLCPHGFPAGWPGWASVRGGFLRVVCPYVSQVKISAHARHLQGPGPYKFRGLEIDVKFV